jgi:uncharacterized membrane protein YbhN (UPF0104 family)
MRALRERTIFVSMLATALSALVVLIIARITGADAVGRAFNHVQLPWVVLVAVAELLTYPAYILAYRSIARLEGHARLELPIVARIVVAGFGPFALSGGFGIDKQALHALQEDPESAHRRVVALGTMEWVILAPAASAVAIILLAEGANILPSLLWPWALAVPAGFGAALWVTAGHRLEWISAAWGGRLRRVIPSLEGVAMTRVLVMQARRYRGAWLGIALYWAADIFAFYCALRMFGLDPGALRVVIAYGTGYAATRRSLPLGGAGVTEFLMTYALYWLRMPLAPALAAVLIYRAFNFLLIAAPAVVAHRQLQPLFDRSRRARKSEHPG